MYLISGLVLVNQTHHKKNRCWQSHKKTQESCVADTNWESEIDNRTPQGLRSSDPNGTGGKSKMGKRLGKQGAGVLFGQRYQRLVGSQRVVRELPAVRGRSQDTGCRSRPCADKEVPSHW